MRVRSACGLLLVLLAVACAKKSDQREYPLQGQVRAIDGEKKQATIAHEDIKGFMPGMTMPYNVPDKKQLDALAPGDLIKARLIVLSNDAYLTDVTKVGEAPLPAVTPDVPAPSASSGFELLKPGDVIPLDTSFVDQDGKTRSFKAFKGTPVILTFMYTKCPIPTFCPMMDRNFAAIQKRVKDDSALKGRVQLVSISFDPIVDTPKVLKAHAAELGADTSMWAFLTGDRDEIDKFAMRFGLSVTRSQNDQRDIQHTLRTVIVDREGKLVKTFKGNEWTPEEALADLTPVVKAG